MEEYLPVLRKLIVIGIWIYIGMQMVPAARDGERNAFVWFFIGLIAFYVPFFAVAIIPPTLMLMAMAQGFDVGSYYNAVGFIAFAAGISVGLGCLEKARKKAAVPASRK